MIRSCRAETKGFRQARKIPPIAISLCIQLSWDHRQNINSICYDILFTTMDRKSRTSCWVKQLKVFFFVLFCFQMLMWMKVNGIPRPESTFFLFVFNRWAWRLLLQPLGSLVWGSRGFPKYIILCSPET